MSLYRTWRPRSFDDLVGQDVVVRTLRTALSSGKLAHAYLFSGPRGSGKTSAAKILARCIDCVNGPTPDPDNTCENCLAILAGTALDVLEIDAASNRGIDEIRALRESVKFAPAVMRSKVFIIDEAHMLTREGANAFLKTLEEPPPHAVFVLATTAPEALPPTILSRCQRYAFRRIPVATMIARMRTIADAEGIVIDDAALGAIAYRADGGLRDALTMLEQVAAFADGPVDAATVDAAFGVTGRLYARDLVGAVLAGDAAGALRVVDSASDAGADMAGLIRAAVAEYRNLLVARIEPDLLERDLSPQDAAATVDLARRTPQPSVVRGLRLLPDALASGRWSGNPRLELETAVLRLAASGEDPSLDALATRVAVLEGALQGGVPRAAVARDGAGAAPGAPPGADAAATASAVPPAANAREAGASRRSGSVRRTAPADAAGEGAEPVSSRRGSVSPAEPAPRTSEAPPSEVTGRVPEPAGPAVGEAPSHVAASAPEEPKERAAAPMRPPEGDGGAPTLQRIRSLWDQIRLRVEEEYRPIRGPLSRATVEALDGDRLTIGLIDDLSESIVRPRVGLLEGALRELLGTDIRVVLAVGGRRDARRGSQRAQPGGDLSPRTEPRTGSQAAESDGDDGGELGLMAYARQRLGGAENR